MNSALCQCNECFVNASPSIKLEIAGERLRSRAHGLLLSITSRYCRRQIEIFRILFQLLIILTKQELDH
jgi:hypothetical protein